MTIKDIKIEGKGLPIREFKMSWLDANASICMIAKRRSGKSWVVRSMLKYFRGLPGGMIISPTDRMSAFYGDFFPEVYIHYEYTSELIDRLLYRQEQMKEKYAQKLKLGKKVDPRVFLVMDDCLADKNTWSKDQNIAEIFMNGRHYRLMYILTMQFPLGIKPELRSNFDFIFLLYDDFQSNQRRLYEHYAGMFPNFDSFKQVFLELTSGHGCMVIVRAGNQSSDILDKIFWYKAKHEKFDNVGCKQFNKIHKDNFNANWRSRTKKVTTDSLFLQKNKPKIRVDKVVSDHN